MPQIKSQKKRVITNEKANERNVAKRTAGDVELAKKLLPETISLIDRAKSDGVYKDNTASRKISRLSKELHNLEVSQNN